MQGLCLGCGFPSPDCGAYGRRQSTSLVLMFLPLSLLQWKKCHQVRIQKKAMHNTFSYVLNLPSSFNLHVLSCDF